MEIYQHVQRALILMMQLSMPVIIAATVVGLIVGLLQALTQIQDQTLPAAAKLIAVGAVILLVGGGLAMTLVQFADEMFSRIAAG